MYLHPYDYETMYVYVHFLHGGIAIFGGFPSFFWMLQVQQVQPSAVLQQPFCFKVPKNDSKKIDSPPKKKTKYFQTFRSKKHIFSSRTTTFFTSSDNARDVRLEASKTWSGMRLAGWWCVPKKIAEKFNGEISHYTSLILVSNFKLQLNLNFYN